MITSFKNVHENFFKLFSEVENLRAEMPVVFTDYNGEEFTAFIRSGHTASPDLSQETYEKYPVISIDKDTPKPRENYNFVKTEYYAAARSSNNDEVRDIITKFWEPTAMQFRYEIAVASKNILHHEIIQDWINKRFMSGNPLKQKMVFNKKLELATVWGTDTLGDLVEYSFTVVADPPRSDGIVETIYECILYPWVHSIESEDVPVIQDIFVGLLQQQR